MLNEWLDNLFSTHSRGNLPYHSRVSTCLRLSGGGGQNTEKIGDL